MRITAGVLIRRGFAPSHKVGLTRDRVEWHLSNWADHIKRGGLPEGHRREAILLTCYATWGYDDSEHQYDVVDAKNAIATGAAIDSLSEIERAAVSHKWLAAIYRMRDLSIQYEKAISNLMIEMDKRLLV